MSHIFGKQARSVEGELPNLLGFCDVSSEQNHAAQTELARQRSQFDRYFMSVEPRDQQLTDLTTKCERRHVCL